MSTPQEQIPTREDLQREAERKAAREKWDGWSWQKYQPVIVRANYKISKLTAERDALAAALRNIESRLDRWGRGEVQRGPEGKDADWPTLLTQVHDALRMVEPPPTKRGNAHFNQVAGHCDERWM